MNPQQLSDISKRIRAEAEEFGPWPDGVGLFVYATGDSWNCSVTAPPETEKQIYKARVHTIAEAMRTTLLGVQ